MRTPLAGLKVVDMGWLMVGPESARYLADLGADVVKVESSVRRDPLRTLGPFKDGQIGINRSLSHHAINAGKRGIVVDAKHPQGREILTRLLAWADVFVESFAAGVIDSLGFSYATLVERNPGLIMVSTSLLGRTGPEATGTSGTGTTGAAFAGATNLLGWPDRAPAGPYGPWTDSVTPRFIVSTVLAALHRRRTTGRGCHIDAAQAECGLQFLLPAYYAFAANGHVPQRRGDAGSPLCCPAGVYPCAGDDRWVAIDASDDASWHALRAVIGGSLLERKFDTLIRRLRARAEIDRLIGDWTSGRAASDVEAALQAAGVSAHVVATSQDLAQDPDLHHQAYFQTITASEIGEGVIRGPQFSLSRTPPVATRAGPQLGQSTVDILTTICGLSPQAVEALQESGALT
ncbi:MAG TPA: CoA transferase [Vineibacter sp.]|nr:CoA transferase [Vineibacter sp.]